MATLIVPHGHLTPRDDAIQLHRAFKGFGSDTEAVINIIAHRDATQRAMIQQEYKAMYHEDLLKRLTSELSGKLETAVLLWMHDPASRDAILVNQAFTGDVIYTKAVHEVICSRTPSQIHTLKQIYHSMFGSPLEELLSQEAWGDDGKLWLAYVTHPRPESFEVNRETVEKDAKSLYKAGEKKFGTDEDKFIKIFSERSRAHLAAVASAYHHMYGTSLKKVIKSETSGNFGFALQTILSCAENPAKFFAKVLHNSMKRLGTDDTTLIRVIVTRTEIDMQYIKAEYQNKYKKSLNDAVHSETSGHYRSFLLTLLGPNH